MTRDDADRDRTEAPHQPEDPGEHHGPLHAVGHVFEEAVEEVEEVDQDLRASGLWIGWMWLLVGVGTAIFLVVMQTAGDSLLTLVVASVFGAIALGLAIYAERPAVIDSVGAKVERPVTRTYLLGVIVAIVVIATEVLPEGFSAWLLLVALLPAIPCLIGAFRVLVTHR